MSAARRPSGSAPRFCVLGTFLLLLALSGLPALAAGINGQPGYTNGPQVCGTCHAAEFDDWLAHGHSRIITQGPILGSWPGGFGLTANARESGIPLADHNFGVFDWDKILFVIGGSKRWKTQLVAKDGHILTQGGENQYNWETGKWVDYKKNEVVPFDCGPCHTTGYRDPEEFPGAGFPGIPGIVGDFAHVNVTCEACHGPGAQHVKSRDPRDIVIDRSTAACSGCHSRGDDEALASGDFLLNHGQNTELLAGAHFFLPCVLCHNGHVGRREGINFWHGNRENCNICHYKQGNDYLDSPMQKAGVRCIDCHMGRATVSARAAGPYEGDVWTHLFRIDSSADYDMFHRDGDGNAVSAKGSLSLEYACFRCHSDASKDAHAAIGDSGVDYHTIGKR